MRLSELERALREEFGALGAVLLSDLVIAELGDRTGRAALAAGVPPKAVWLALCTAQQVPLERRHGAGLRRPTGGGRGDTP